MATNKEKNEDISIKKCSNFDIPVDGVNKPGNDRESYESIDAVCDMMGKAKQEKADEDEKRRKDLAKKKQQEHDNVMAAKKAEDEKAKQKEETRKINEAKYMRKKSKRNATIMTFCLCISSAVFSYITVGILIWLAFKPPVWLFVGIMGIIGMIDTFLNTYLYRFIREEIYRK